MPKKKAPARPTKMIHIRLTETVHRKLKMETAKEGKTIQEWVTKLIEERLPQKSA